MSTMKISIISSAPSNPSSGVGGVAANLSRRFSESGHSCSLVSNESIFPAIKGILKQFLFAFALPFYPGLTSSHVLDIGAGDGFFVPIILRLRRLPSRPLLVARSHGLEHVIHQMLLDEARAGKIKLSWKYSLYNGGYRLWQVKKYLQSADLVFFLSNHDREYAVKNFELTNSRLKIVDNGLPEYFIGRAFGPTNLAAPKLAIVGSFSERKGCNYAIPALIELLQRHENLGVGFFGTNTDQSIILSEFPVPLRPRIEVVSRYEHERLPELLSGYNIMLMSSLAEGYGMVALEGMACGLALVATNVSGIAERLIDGENAILIQSRSVEQIVEGVEALFQNPASFERIRRSGYELAQNFTWEQVAKNTLEHYREAMLKKKTCDEQS